MTLSFLIVGLLAVVVLSMMVERRIMEGGGVDASALTPGVLAQIVASAELIKGFA